MEDFRARPAAIAKMTVKLQNYQTDLLNNFLSGREYDLHGTTLSSVRIRGNVRIVGNGDIQLDLGRGIKAGRTGIAFGNFANVPAVTFYINNTLVGRVTTGGVALEPGNNYYLDAAGTNGLYSSDNSRIIKFETLSGLQAIGFYTNGNLRAKIDSNGFTLSSGLTFTAPVISSNFINPTNLGLNQIAYYDLARLVGASDFTYSGWLQLGLSGFSNDLPASPGIITNKYIGIVTALTNASGFSLAISGGQSQLSSFASGSGTALPMSFYVAGNENVRLDNTNSATNTCMLLFHNGVFARVKVDASDLGSGAKKYLYL